MIVLILLLAIALFLLPKLLGNKFLVVLSQSMEPTIPMGSVVITKPVNTQEIQVGDIITFRMQVPYGFVTVTHRVIEVDNERLGLQFRTQGDASLEPDPDNVLAANVIGKVLFHIPYIGYLLSFIHTIQGFILLVVLPAGILLAGEIQDIIRILNKKKEMNTP